MKRPITIISAALLLSAAASAQNLNPVVEVTNTYEGRLSDIHKPDQVMNIPDSVTHFKLDFDYSVFEKPYRGAYEFSPYLVAMTPQAAPSDASRFYLKAGAGYTLRPELNFVWTPQLKNGFGLNLHGDARSFFGEYRNIFPEAGEEALLVKSDGTKTKGHYVRGGLGTDFSYAWKSGEAGLSLDYVKQFENYPVTRNYDGVLIHPSVRSTDPDATFYYEASLLYRYGNDKLLSGNTFQTLYEPYNPVREHYSAFDATFGPVLDPARKILVDLSLAMDHTESPVLYYFPSHPTWATVHGSSPDKVKGGTVSLTPKYCRTGDRLSWWAGVRLAVNLGGGETNDLPTPGLTEAARIWTPYSHRGQVLFPEAGISYRLTEESLTVYATATGGPRMNTYGSMLERNRYFSLWRLLYSNMEPLDHSIERINLRAGVKGNVKKRLQWDLSGGFAVWDNALVDKLGTDVSFSGYCGSFGYSDMKLAFADLKVLFDSQNVDIDGILSFKHATGLEEYVFTPAALTGDIKATYDWNGRIRAGVRGDFATRRTTRFSQQQYSGATLVQSVRIPGYVDLGVFGEYVFNRRWSVWAKTGNLLNMTIQRTPFFAEDGIYATAGVCLNIR